jgi:hypothetical protein
MALNFPSSPINGQEYIDSNGTVWEYNSTKTVWGTKRNNELKEFSGAKLEFTTVSNLTNTLSPISWDTTSFDTDAYYDSINYPSRLIVQRTAYYRINVLLLTGTQGNGASYTFSIKVNGSTVLTTDTAGPNQGIHFDEIILLHSNDYVEIFASEQDAVGTILTTSYFELERVGYSMGSAFTPRGAFSGVRVLLSSVQNTTSTPTVISWNSTDFNVNADINGSVYWDISNQDKITIYTTGYYRVKSMFETGPNGTADSYTIDVRLDGTTLESASLGPLETLDLDEVYNFTSGSYLQTYIDNSGSVGTITTDSYFELIRMGV